jgi:SprT-like family protein
MAHSCKFLTKAKMQRDYDKFNKLYFDGKLPHAELYFVDRRNPVTGSKEPLKEIKAWEKKTLAETSTWRAVPDKRDVQKVDDRHEIRFARVFRTGTGRDLFNIVLLHEMIHIKHSGHGKAFQREKRRLIYKAKALENLI